MKESDMFFLQTARYKEKNCLEQIRKSGLIVEMTLTRSPYNYNLIRFLFNLCDIETCKDACFGSMTS